MREDAGTIDEPPVLLVQRKRKNHLVEVLNLDISVDVADCEDSGGIEGFVHQGCEMPRRGRNSTHVEKLTERTSSESPKKHKETEHLRFKS